MSLFFETIRVENKNIYNLDFHNKRLNYTIEKNYHIKKDINLKDFILPPKDSINYRCKVIYDKDIKDINFYPYIQKKIKRFKLIYSNIKYNYKYVDRTDIDKLFLQKEGNDDILIVDKNGYLKDTSIANIAIKQGNIWFTPKNPLLKGTMRERLIKENILIQKDIKLQDIKNIDSFAIINAMIGFYEITNPIFK